MNIIESNLKFNGTLKIRSITNKILLHHSGVTVLQSVETIHNYHKNSNGWAGIGYQFYVRKDGNIYTGRPDNTVGAHATNNNTDSIGICFEGNFEVETMEEAQKRAGQELVTHLKSKYGINEIKQHKDVNSTSCAGKNFPFYEIVSGITVENKPDENVATAEKIKTVQVKSTLALREKPTTNSRNLGNYLNKTTVIVLEENVATVDGFTWDKVKIRVSPTKVGYMANKYLV